MSQNRSPRLVVVISQHPIPVLEDFEKLFCLSRRSDVHFLGDFECEDSISSQCVAIDVPFLIENLPLLILRNPQRKKLQELHNVLSKRPDPLIPPLINKKPTKSIDEKASYDRMK